MIIHISFFIIRWFGDIILLDFCLHCERYHWHEQNLQGNLACDTAGGRLLVVTPGTHVNKDLGTYNPNLVKFHVALSSKTRIRSDHNLAHVTTAELSWHVQNCDLIEWIIIKIRVKLNFAKFLLWAHKSFVKWFQGGRLFLHDLGLAKKSS